MQPRTDPQGQDAIAGIIAGSAAALAGPSGDNSEQRQARIDAAATTMRQFEPRTVIEAMLACHSVIFHCLLNDAVDRVVAAADPATPNDAVPAKLIALNNAFHRNLDRFERCRKRRAETDSTASREIPAGGRNAAVHPSVKTQALTVETRAAAPVATPRPEDHGPLSGPPARLTSSQQPQGAVDRVGSDSRPVNPSAVIRSEASVN